MLVVSIHPVIAAGFISFLHERRKDFCKWSGHSYAELGFRPKAVFVRIEAVEPWRTVQMSLTVKVPVNRRHLEHVQATNDSLPKYLRRWLLYS